MSTTKPVIKPPGQSLLSSNNSNLAGSSFGGLAISGKNSSCGDTSVSKSKSNYLSTFLTSFVGRSPPKSNCHYQLLGQTDDKGGLSNHHAEEDAFLNRNSDDEFADLPGEGQTTLIDMKLLNSSTHLVGEKKSRKKKIIWGSVIGAVVIAIIVVVVVLVTKKDDDATEPTTKQPLELNDFLGSTYSASHFNGTFISDHEILYQNSEGILVLYDVTAKTETVVLSDEEKLSTVQGIWLSPNKEYLLLARERTPIYRHSFNAIYDILVLATKAVIPITIDNQQVPLQLAEWNPVSNGIVLVYNNNIYYKSSPTDTPRQITVDGSPLIHNGIPDWVYEEEVFASNSALWFSPDGNKLAYAHFDDTPVRTMILPIYGTPGSIDFQYTRQAGVLYPKAGSPNPIVNLFSVDLTTTAVELVHLAYVGPAVNQKPLLTAVTWIDNSQVLAVWMNRVQNAAYIHKCTGSECSQLATITSTTGWVDLMTAPLKNKDGSKVAIIASQPQEGGDSFKHLSLVSTATPNTIVALTKGKFVVTEILKWDAETDLIFYMANTEANSEYNHLYVIKADGSGEPACLSCGVVDGSTPMTYFSASISSGDKNIVALSADGPAVPKTELYTVQLSATGVISKELTMNWELNAALDTKLENVDLPTIEKDTIDLGNGFSAKVKMQLPPGLDKAGNEKYPMIIDVYGGPDSNGVLDRWSIDYGTYMSSHKKVIYTRIDGRGSGLRGDALMHQIYRKLGTAEIEDQITTAKKLAEKYSFIDGERIAIWGWSYGGYASAMALAKDTGNTLKCAASVAPVTDWAYYDSIYTERYMGLPSPLDNQVGYDTARLSTMANAFSGKKFLLIHGTLDDNVHYQQAMALSRSLERNDILFKQITYPDENHSLSGVRPHLYHSLSRYFSECFGISEEF